MKKLAFLLTALLILLCVAGCGKTSDSMTQPTDPSIPEPDPVQIYAEAIENYDHAYIELDAKRQVQAGTESFSEDWKFTLQYKNLGGDDFSAGITTT